ncbi:hypothetical protein R6M67_17070, partial [Streptomyces sp. Wh19]|nr:hypothetical protein [Streptomyces sp. Wh19]
MDSVLSGAGRDILRVVTYNLREGGLDGDGVETGTGAIDISRWEQEIDLMGRLEPDVLCFQECKYYDRNDFEMARRTGQALDMEWYLAPSDSHGSHLMTLGPVWSCDLVGPRPGRVGGLGVKRWGVSTSTFRCRVGVHLPV